MGGGIFDPEKCKKNAKKFNFSSFRSPNTLETLMTLTTLKYFKAAPHPIRITGFVTFFTDSSADGWAIRRIGVYLTA